MKILTVNVESMKKELEDIISDLLFDTSKEYLFVNKKNNLFEYSLLKPAKFSHELLKSLNRKCSITTFSKVNNQLFKNFKTELVATKNKKKFNKKILIQHNNQVYTSFYSFKLTDYIVYYSDKDNSIINLSLFIKTYGDDLNDNIQYNKFRLNIPITHIMILQLLNNDISQFKNILNLNDLINRKYYIQDLDEYEVLDLFSGNSND